MVAGLNIPRDAFPCHVNGAGLTRAKFFLNEKDKIPIQISLKLVPRGPIDNKPALVQVMVCRRTGDKPLPEPMMVQFTDAYMWHWVEMS